MIIPPTWTLPEAIRTRLGQTTYGRQRAIFEDGHLLLVLHKPPGPRDSKREGVLFWRSPANEWHWSRGSGAAALKRHVQSYAELEAKLVSDYAGAKSSQALFDMVEALTPLTRAAKNMHAALQTAREAVKSDAFLIETRDFAYEVDRNLDLLLEDVRNSIQQRTAREAEQQSRSAREALRASHRLNVLAAMFFPLTALASLFGMQLNHGINERSPLVFWVIFAVGVGLGLLMKRWVLGGPEKKKIES